MSSFEPKNEQKYFCISVLVTKMGQIIKKYYRNIIIMLISDYLISNTYDNLHSFFDLTYFRKVRQKYRNIFNRFLVQMKTSKSHCEIN